MSSIQVEKCCLDFDANANSIEKCPAENISFNNVGVFPIKVNNFNNRDKKDVPFKAPQSCFQVLEKPRNGLCLMAVGRDEELMWS